MSDPLATAAELLRAGKSDKAVALLLPLLRRSPEHAPLRYLLGASYRASGDFPAAMFHLSEAMRLGPRNLAIVLDLARATLAGGKQTEAIELYRRALEIDPRHVLARRELTDLHLSRDELPAAEDLLRRTVREHPDLITAWMGLAGLEMMTGRGRSSAALLREAIAHNPTRPELDSYLSMTQTYLPGVSCRDAFAAHRAFGVKTMSHIRETPAEFTGPRDPERPLIVGWLSPDLRRHSIAYFLEPLLANLDKKSFTSVLLATGQQRDAVTQRLSHHGKLVPCHHLEHKELPELIRRENVDILIELSGHTTDHRLFSLARKPAPIIVSYLGYAHTTGLPTVDYRIVDEITDPPADAPPSHRLGLETSWPFEDPAEASQPWPGADAFATESLVRLSPTFLCYRPPDDAPEAAPPPSHLRPAPFTFGSFSAMQKIHPELVGVWAEAMRAVPGSRIILKGEYRLSAARAATLAWFEAAGISADRVELRTFTPGAREHLTHYADLDIALDTFPYNGTTTTCEALHMGVPVLSLVGKSHASRVGFSLLSALGLADMVCDSPQQLARKAAELASDKSVLAELHRTLRERLAHSPLCDGPAHAARFGAVLRGMWRRYAGAAQKGPA